MLLGLIPAVGMKKKQEEAEGEVVLWCTPTCSLNWLHGEPLEPEWHFRVEWGLYALHQSVVDVGHEKRYGGLGQESTSLFLKMNHGTISWCPGRCLLGCSFHLISNLFMTQKRKESLNCWAHSLCVYLDCFNLEN